MKGKTHKVGGFCSGAIVTTLLLKPPYTPDKIFLAGVLISGAIFGSLIPDIDHPESTIGKKVKLISNFIHNVFGHRGMTHAPIIHILTTTVLLLIGNGLLDYPKLIYLCFVIGLCIGGLSHLLLDSMTVSGIPLFYPFSKNKYRISKLTTGKSEHIVQLTVIVITVIFIKLI